MNKSDESEESSELEGEFIRPSSKALYKHEEEDDLLYQQISFRPTTEEQDDEVKGIVEGSASKLRWSPEERKSRMSPSQIPRLKQSSTPQDLERSSDKKFELPFKMPENSSPSEEYGD